MGGESIMGNMWETIRLLIIVILSILGTSFIAIFIYKYKHEKLLQNLEDMLEEGIKGTFKERIYDESKLSAVEHQMAKYIANCSASATHLKKEKNHIETLIADISHQTKTPIANILLYAQLLKEQEMEESGRTCVEVLTQNAEKLNFLITALVKLSRLETGIIQLALKEEGLEEFIKKSVEQVQFKARQKSIDIKVEIQDHARAYFDMKWTMEAVSNLLDNAIKYSSSNTCITIKVESYEFFVRIDIKDEGIGIQEEEHSKIFQRFYRSYEVANEEGVGIGLYLAREIISNEGGYIKLSSKVGEGSTFSVFLPILHEENRKKNSMKDEIFQSC